MYLESSTNSALLTAPTPPVSPPTLTGLEYGEQFLYSGTLDLRREEFGGRPCNIHYARERLCRDEAGEDILRAVQARLPRADWIRPAIWLMSLLSQTELP